VLDGKVSLADALVKDERSNLVVLPALVKEMSSGAFQAEAIGALMTQLRQQFDVIIIDTAPVLAVADTRLLGWLSDSTLMVCRWRKSSIKAAKVSVDILNQSGARVVGTARCLWSIPANMPQLAWARPMAIIVALRPIIRKLGENMIPAEWRMP
jgi:Mrp family chromosome partitioning ATPase